MFSSLLSHFTAFISCFLFIIIFYLILQFFCIIIIIIIVLVLACLGIYFLSYSLHLILAPSFINLSFFLQTNKQTNKQDLLGLKLSSCSGWRPGSNVVDSLLDLYERIRVCGFCRILCCRSFDSSVFVFFFFSFVKAFCKTVQKTSLDIICTRY